MKSTIWFIGKRAVAITLISLLFMSCQSSKNPSAAISKSLINQEILHEDGEKILVGKINREGLALENYRYWYEEEYQSYTVDVQTLEGLKKSFTSTQILVFLGTWCSDSQRELPHFYKIMDYLGISENQYTIVALDNHPDRYKKSPQQEEAGWNIEYVPTFIVLKNGKEIGRIVEAPMESLEKDLVAILKGTNMVH